MCAILGSFGADPKWFCFSVHIIAVFADILSKVHETVTHLCVGLAVEG